MESDNNENTLPSKVHGAAYAFCEVISPVEGKSSFRCKASSKCSQVIKGKNISNFERHLKRNHPNIYKAVEREKEAEREKKRHAEENCVDAMATKKRRTLNGVRLSMEDIIEACLSMVADSARPFAAIDDPGFQVIIQALLKAMPPEERRQISAYTIRDRVSDKARDITLKMSRELSNRLLCVKIDSATRGSRVFLGINAQYIDGRKIVLRTLALKEMKVRCTAANIKLAIEDVFEEYGIPVGNVYAVTSDNGANMVLAGRLLGSLAEEVAYLEQEEDNHCEAENEEHELEYVAEEEVCTDDEGEEDVPLADLAAMVARNRESNDGDSVEEAVRECLGENNVNIIRCAAHCLQLAVGDALKCRFAKSVIGKIQRLAKALKRSNNANLLRNMGLNIPKLYNATRWNSVPDMLSSLLPLRNFCERFASTANLPNLSATEWRRAADMLTALEPARVATKKLQEEQLLYGDFYGTWLTCKLQTKKIGTRFGNALLVAMEEREKLLVCESAFLAAVYMDPRYFALLKPAQVTTAESHLVKLWSRIERLNAPDQPTVPQPQAEERTEGANYADLEEMLRESDTGRLVIEESSLRVDILPKLKWLLSQPRLQPVTADVLGWWDSRKYMHPELHALALVALSVPATQVSVERLFSGMKHLLGDKRLMLTDEALHQLMVIRQYNLWTKKNSTTCQDDTATRTRTPLADAPCALNSMNISSCSEAADSEFAAPLAVSTPRSHATLSTSTSVET